MQTGFVSWGGRSRRPPSFWWLPLLAFLMASCQMPGLARNEEMAVENPDRLPFPGWVKALAFFEGGQRLVAGGCEAGGPDEDQPCKRGLVSVWRLKGMQPAETLRLPRAVTALTVSPDGTKWVAGDSDGRLILSTNRRKDLRRPLHHTAEITALTFSPDGQWIASGSLDAFFPLGLMDVKTGGVIKVKVPFEPVSALAFSRDGKELGIGMQNGSVLTWSFTSEATPVSVAAKSSQKQLVSSLAFSPDDRFLAYGRQDGRVVIVDRVSAQTLIEMKYASAVTALAFSPDGRNLAIGQESGKVILIESGQAHEIWSKRHILPIADLAYSPDGTSLAVAVQQGVYLYQVGDLEPKSGFGPRTARNQTAGLPAPAGLRGALNPDVSSRKFARVLQISQDEFLWLIPFDRLILSSVESMLKVVPEARVEQGISPMPDQVRLTAGGGSVVLDLNRLRQAEGRTGLHETIRMYESAQRVLLSARPGAATALEDAAVSAILAELGPGLRLVHQPSLDVMTANQMHNGPDGDRGKSAKVVMEMTGGQRVKYFRLTRIDHSAARQMQRWVDESSGTQGRRAAYVLDLRDNAGADLESAVETSETLLAKGMLITELIARKTGERTAYHAKGAKLVPYGLVVLVNERTAGSAELLACAIREAGVGVLVGARTAGVDEVYGTFPLPGQETLRVSTGRFYCPGERSIRWTGQPADVEVDQAAVSGVVPLGSAQTGRGRHEGVANLMTVGLSNVDDQQLRVGIEIALCLSLASQQMPVNRLSAGRRPDAASWLHACR